MPERDSDRSKSRSQRKREHLELKALGEVLVGLSAGQLARLGLDEALRAAVEEARPLARSAYRRQLRYLARCLSRANADSIRRDVEFICQTGRAAGARHRRMQRLRDRLVEDGDAAIQGLLGEQPGIDRQRLRQLVRSAQGERADEPPGRHHRALLRYLQHLTSGELPPRDEGD